MLDVSDVGKILFSIYVLFLYLCWLCLTSHQQQGHLKMAPLFTVPCEGREAR